PLNESQRTIAFVIIVGVSNKSGSVIAGMVAQLITEWWLSCTGQGAQRAPDSSAFKENQCCICLNPVLSLYFSVTYQEEDNKGCCQR
ncbi:MAG: hypothetical protein MR671_11745, partial [Clostridiales bacterium]|nr:hypothetical protein [Clostridiales bacterium]